LLTESVSVIPGGVRDMMTTTPGVIHIVPRKGVFRLALETGTPIVPVLTYGENELFPAIHLSFNEWL
jgi:2-acylglycerol O-acyltransferase 2